MSFKNTIRMGLCLALVLASTALSAAGHEKPKLVLQITVDQLRGDLPIRYYDRLGEGGFRYLLEQGVVYRNAHHPHANTETIVGHTTLATGSYPSIHGMVGNLWFDRETGQTTYNVEDPDYRLLTAGADVDAGAEIDPTQRAAKTEGRSPRAILSSTFSDELRASNGGRSRVIGISVKDRGAIAMAGHAGTAYWFSKASGEFVTSDYYLERYPNWVNQWNSQQYPQRYANTNWELMHERNSYFFGDSDDRPWEADIGGFGRVFPHAFGDGESPYFTTLLTISPAGDELVLDFATAALVNEKLGKDTITDYLSVSFSATDYVGHMFGPSSLESEDNILRLDRTLAKLLTTVDKQVGLENTLVVLSADHGGPDTPGYLNSLGIPAGYVNPQEWDRESAITRIKQQFGIEGKLIETYNHPYVYFSRSVYSNPDLDVAALEAATAAEISRFKGVYTAVSSTALRNGDTPDNEIYNAVLKNFHPKRSGDIFLVFEPNWFINDMEGLLVASTHGSPWRYDTFVPIIFAGSGLKAKVVDREVHTVDIAPTLSTFVGVKQPSGTRGHPLVEVLEAKQ
ncbi:MAG: alkaline phosphatase family protein [Xanthomonadales bacterium]|nr:alkaline phosphatase family protein [Gammaproteobacteria bacterium]MBT8072643.1 alkaline phosphatase family protein [Gammaproteobacteria bacterium]NNK03484.1 alkaline phosphatase family protein [Xanthomonadales bacterium]